MERYVVITAKSDKMYVLMEINSDTLQVSRLGKGVFRDVEIAGAIAGCRPINFSIENGMLCSSMGSFDRLEIKDNVTPHIVIQELVTTVGTIVGYRLLNPFSKAIVAMKKEDIIARQAKSSVPLLQNGIIRGNKINCYPNSPFPKFVIGAKTRSAVKKPVLPPKEQEEAKQNNDFLSQFTPEQRRELSKAKTDNVDIRIIANPKLSPEQMRVIWVAKKKGVYSEYFAKPEYSVDVMKFYADRLVTQQVVKECADLLARPSYDVERLTELYLAVCEGVDYSSFLDEDDVSAMRVKREKLRVQLWGTQDHSDEYINNAIKFAEKLKKG